MRITHQYFASNRAVEELRRLARSIEADPCDRSVKLPRELRCASWPRGAAGIESW